MPKFSVIVPVYRVEEYLEACLNSVLRQTYGDFELILVDDGSPDRCPEICDAYAAQDSHVRVIHKKNGGPSEARNAGLDAAAGEYIYFLDSDDTIDPALLETVAPYMDAGMDLVVFEYRLVYEDGSTQAFHFREHGAADLLDEAARRNYIIQKLLTYDIGWEVTNRVFRREKIKDYGLRFADKRQAFSNFAEDLYFSLCYCAHAEKIISLDACFYNYRKRPGSIMAENRFKLNGNRYNELGKAALDFFRQFDDCGKLIESFHTIHYLLMAGRIMDEYNASGLTCPEYREAMTADLSDWAFFEKQMTRQLQNPRELKECYPRMQNLEQLIYMRFLLGGGYTVLRIRIKLLWWFSGILKGESRFADLLENWFWKQISKNLRLESRE